MPSYRTREYGGSISFGFKVAVILAILGLMACLWIAVPGTDPDVKDLKAGTARLAQGIYSALKEMKEAPADAGSAWQSLAEIATCSNCAGTGTVEDETGSTRCPVCKGAGINVKQGKALALRRALLKLVPCPRCRGTGRIRSKNCEVCGGSGHLNEEVREVLKNLAAGQQKDVWGHRFKLSLEPAEKGVKVEVRSAGPDGRYSTSGKGDDVIIKDPD
jgi:hypothetical protein